MRELSLLISGINNNWQLCKGAEFTVYKDISENPIYIQYIGFL